MLLYIWIKLIDQHYFGIKETGSCLKDAGRISTEYRYSTDQGRSLFSTLHSLNKDTFIVCKSEVRSHNKMNLYSPWSTTTKKILLRGNVHDCCYHTVELCPQICNYSMMWFQGYHQDIWKQSFSFLLQLPKNVSPQNHRIAFTNK